MVCQWHLHPHTERELDVLCAVVQYAFVVADPVPNFKKEGAVHRKETPGHYWGAHNTWACLRNAHQQYVQCVYISYCY